MSEQLIIHRITPKNPPQFPCWVYGLDMPHLSDSPLLWYLAADASETDPRDTHWCRLGPRPTVTPDANTAPEQRGVLPIPGDLVPVYAPTPPALPPTKPSDWPEWVQFGPKDWPDTGDNGCYQHTCRSCGTKFHGNKRRAPECRECATPPAPTPTLPPEVREAIAGATTFNRLTFSLSPEDAGALMRDVIAALAPLWPRPAPTPALPDEVRDAIEDAINKTNNPPFFDRLPKWSEARGELINRLLGNLAPLWRPAPVPAEAEENLRIYAAWNNEEREQLRTYAASLLARAEAAERELARWVEQLSLETNAGPTGDHMATSKAWQAVRKERDDLRAENQMLRAWRTALVTADARELAKKCLDVYSSVPFGTDAVAPIAAILAPVLAERDRLHADLIRRDDDTDAQLAAARPIEIVENIAGNIERFTPTQEQVQGWFDELAAAQADKERLDWLEQQLNNMDPAHGGSWLRIGDNGRIQIHQYPVPHHPTHTVWHDEICTLDSIPDTPASVRAAIDAARQKEARHD